MNNKQLFYCSIIKTLSLWTLFLSASSVPLRFIISHFCLTDYIGFLGHEVHSIPVYEPVKS